MAVVDNTGWRAAQEVFGTRIRHLLCQWHLHSLCKLLLHVTYVLQSKHPVIACALAHTRYLSTITFRKKSS